jgi:hypothetical protein
VASKKEEVRSWKDEMRTAYPLRDSGVTRKQLEEEQEAQRDARKS